MKETNENKNSQNFFDDEASKIFPRETPIENQLSKILIIYIDRCIASMKVATATLNNYLMNLFLDRSWSHEVSIYCCLKYATNNNINY